MLKNLFPRNALLKLAEEKKLDVYTSREASGSRILLIRRQVEGRKQDDSDSVCLEHMGKTRQSTREAYRRAIRKVENL